MLAEAWSLSWKRAGITISLTLSWRLVSSSVRLTERIVGRVRRDPGAALLLLACLLAVALYAPTLGRGLVNHDDPWLVRDNWIVSDLSVASLRTIAFDLDRDTRAVLGAEYLPVRDLAVMLDTAVWGDTYAGHHLTNIVLYVLALVAWFAALCALGLSRTLAGLAILLWAVHPTHAESVAWLSERKGLLALALSGTSALGYARFRRGGSVRWLVLAAATGVLAVWSKALAGFAIAALAALELAVPSARISWRRSVTGLAVLALAAGAAFVPVLLVASRMSVVAGDVASPGGQGWLAMVLGIHGFYLRLGAAAVPNAVTYPINTDGPATLDIVLGALGFGAAIAVFAIPRIRRSTVFPALACAVGVWLVGYFPASRIVLPVRLVVAADRYLLFPTLGIAIALAAVVLALPRARMALALGAALVLAGSARTLDAQASWQDARSLWSRAVASNPHDGNAWSMYAEALADAGDLVGAEHVANAGLARTSDRRLLLRRALLLARRGDTAEARAWMLRAADAGEPIAMTNLALMLADAGDPATALDWARKAVAAAPLYVNGHRILGKIALAQRLPAEANAAFALALALEPTSTNRYNLALALAALGRTAEAREELEVTARDPAFTARARAELARLPR